MRARLLLLVVLLLAAPTALAGVKGCWLLPPGAFPGVGGCQLTFASGAGTIVVWVETLQGSVGEVVIEGGKQASPSTFVATCTLAQTSGFCTPAISLFALTPGTYTVTGLTTNANLYGSDSRVWMGVSYPDF